MSIFKIEINTSTAKISDFTKALWDLEQAQFNMMYDLRNSLGFPIYMNPKHIEPEYLNCRCRAPMEILFNDISDVTTYRCYKCGKKSYYP